MRFVRVIRLPACARVSRVSRVSRVCPGSPRCLFTGNAPPAAPGSPAQSPELLAFLFSATCMWNLPSCMRGRVRRGEEDDEPQM